MSINENAHKILKEKQYFQEGESVWEDICKRVSIAIAEGETIEELKIQIQQDIYDAMVNLDFIFSTPCLLNANKDNPGQLSSCFIAETRDTIEDICKMDAEFAKIFQRNGGVGTDLSVLRPAQSQVETSKGYAGGIITFMNKYDSTADEMTKFNPSRKGAIKINLQDWHPQIKNFIQCKSDTSLLKRMNISCSFFDEFMNAVENDLDWNLEFPDYTQCKEIYNKEWNGNLQEWKEKGYPVKIYEAVKAKDLFIEFVKASWQTGEPGANFQSRMNIDNMNPHLSKEIYTNPCNEFTNIPYSSCNLGSINLFNCIEKGKFNWKKLTDLTSKAVIWLDDMITVNILPLSRIDEVTKQIRPIGLGVMGLADALFALKIKYNSQEGYEFAEKIIKTIKQQAVTTSIELAKEKGEYPAWEGSVWHSKDIKIRNSNLLSIAPTGTISIIANVSSGCEPCFGLTYSRRTYDGNIYYMTNETFKEELEKRKIYSEELMSKIEKNHGSCKGILEIPLDIQEVFVTAHDLTPQEHIDMVAVLQKHVDLSLSKTVNFSNNATIEDIYNIYLYGWKKGLKGLTVYRDGSRKNQTLSTNRNIEDKEIENNQDLPWGTVIEASDDLIGKKRKVVSGCGNVHVEAWFDPVDGKLMEVFLSKGSNGGCLSWMITASRLTSCALRSGSPFDYIVDQLKSAPTCPSYVSRRAVKKDTSKGDNCSSAIAYKLEEMQKEMFNELNSEEEHIEEKIIIKNPCPDCGNELNFEGGCNSCKACGYSKCG